MEKNREYSLDILKVLATTIILFHHYQQGSGAIFKYINFWDGKFYFGYLVELFFVLSGYFSYSYIKKIKSGWRFDSFILKKAARLIPLLALSVFAEAAIYAYRNHLGAEIDLSLWSILLNAVGLQCGWVTQTRAVNGPTWYLSVLLLCYMLFYVTTFLSKRLSVRHVYFYIIMIGIGIAVNSYSISGPFLNSSTARGYISFFTGILLAEFLNKYEKQIKKIEAAALAVFACILVLILFKFDFISDGISYILVFLMYPSTIILLKSKYILKICNINIFGILGAIAFNTYVWHEPLTALRNLLIVRFSWNIDITSLKSMLVFALAAWIAGTISFFCIEKPIQKFMNTQKKEQINES